MSVSIDGKNFFWIVIYNDKLIKNPTKEDLIGTKLISYNKTNICPRCREDNQRYGVELSDKSILYPKNARHDVNKEGKHTEEYVCKRHYDLDYQRYDPNSNSNMIKSMRPCRIGKQDPNSNQIKGKKSQKLASRSYGWEDLNEKYDNNRTPIDCYDPKMGLYHQVQGRHYNSIDEKWAFTEFEREREKIFEDMICFCFSKDGKIVERIYKFPLKEIMERTSAVIYKNPTDWVGDPKIAWYEKYRVKNEDELKKANEIWIQILEEENMKTLERKITHNKLPYDGYIAAE